MSDLSGEVVLMTSPPGVGLSTVVAKTVKEKLGAAGGTFAF